MRCCNYSVIYKFDTQFVIMNSALIIIYDDVSVILTMAYYF